MEETKTRSSSAFWPFIGKTAAVLLLVAIFVDFMLPDFAAIKRDIKEELVVVKEHVDKNFKNERTKLYVLSFVQNPAALYKTSEIAEREARLDSAIRDMELAIGLLEMHRAEKQVLSRYYDRLEKLRSAATKSK